MNFTEYVKNALPESYKKYALNFDHLLEVTSSEHIDERADVLWITEFDEKYQKLSELIEAIYNTFKEKFEFYKNDKLEELEGLYPEVDDFCKFTRLNIIALKKLANKHDFISSNKVYPIYRSKFVSETAKIEELVNDYKMNIYGSQSNYENISKKNISTNYCYITALNNLNELQEHFINNNNYVKESINKPRKVYTIYFDTKYYQNYTDKLYYKPNAQLIYINCDELNPNIMTVQRSFISNDSNEVVEGFFIKQIHLNDFLNGLDIWNELVKYNTLSHEQVYYKIKYIIEEENLSPVTKVISWQMDFKLDDQTYSSGTINTNINMYRINNTVLINNYDPDINEIIMFPFVLLTLNLKEGSFKQSELIENLIITHFLAEIPNFNIYLLTISFIYDVKEIPNWIHKISVRKFKDDTLSHLHLTKQIKEVVIQVPDAISNCTESPSINLPQESNIINTNKVISWINLTLIVGGLGIFLVVVDSPFTYMTGTVFVGLAMISCLYSLYLFVKLRRERVNLPSNIYYEPYLLVVFFILMCFLALIFAIPLE